MTRTVTPENLPKEAPCQVVLGQLEHEVPRVPDQPPAGLEEPLLQVRQGPALEGERQNQPALNSITERTTSASVVSYSIA